MSRKTIQAYFLGTPKTAQLEAQRRAYAKLGKPWPPKRRGSLEVRD